MDLAIGRCLGCSNITTATSNFTTQFDKKTIGIRSDYIKHNIIDYFSGRDNFDDWEIQPSLCFNADGKLKVLTCSNHDDGDAGKYLHLPKNPYGVLTSSKSDELAPAVIRPRILKPIKRKKFSNIYSMHEMQGNFSGVDTMYVKEKGDFNSSSKISAMNECLAINERTDVKSLCSSWTKEGINPSSCAEIIKDKLNLAERNILENEKRDNCIAGATYVSLFDAMKLQKLLNERNVIPFNKFSIVESEEINDNGLNFNVQKKELEYLPPWSKYLINVHPHNDHGASPYRITKPVRDSITDTRLLWIMKGLVLLNPDIWTSTVNSITNNCHWGGWLMLLFGEIFPNIRSSNRTKQLFEVSKFGKGDLERNAMNYLGMKINARSETICNITDIEFDAELGNGFFHPDHISKLFSKDDDISVQEFSNITLDNIVCNVNTIIIYRENMVNNDELLPMLKDSEENVYELRNVFFTSILSEEKKTWQGGLFFAMEEKTSRDGGNKLLLEYQSRLMTKI